MFKMNTKSLKSATKIGLTMTMIVFATACAEKHIESEALQAPPTDENTESVAEVWPSPEPESNKAPAVVAPEPPRKKHRSTFKSAHRGKLHSQRKSHPMLAKHHAKQSKFEMPSAVTPPVTTAATIAPPPPPPPDIGMAPPPPPLPPSSQDLPTEIASTSSGPSDFNWPYVVLIPLTMVAVWFGFRVRKQRLERSLIYSA